jgi:hypothetical protein
MQNCVIEKIAIREKFITISAPISTSIAGIIIRKVLLVKFGIKKRMIYFVISRISKLSQVEKNCEIVILHQGKGHLNTN